MSSEERRRSRAIGLLVSAAIHVAMALLILQIPPSPATGAGAQRRVSINGRAVLPQGSARQLPSPHAAAARESGELVAGSRAGAEGSHAVPPGRTAARLVHAAGSWMGSTSAAAVQRLRPSNQSGDGRWINHLWQSTMFVFVVALASLAFRQNRAAVRYALWFTASVKFLIPLSAITALGSMLPWGSTVRTVVAPAVTSAFEPFAQPFVERTSLPPLAPALPTEHHWIQTTAAILWLAGMAAIVLRRAVMWRRVITAMKQSVPLQLTDAVPSRVGLRSAPAAIEPGVVGFWKPTILLPQGIETRLTSEQLQAVLAHELCHVRRRDNFTAAIHMAVEAVFWFHPMVWWIGARLVDERERACDEEVVSIGSQPRDYAEAIINVCKHYMETQLACVSGVSGSDLRRRIETIMQSPVVNRLNSWKKAFLAVSGTATVVIPLVMGAISTPLLPAAVVDAQAPTSTATAAAFETASVKVNRAGALEWRLEPQPGGRITAVNTTLNALIRFAYDRMPFQVTGGPEWLGDERFDVLAKAEGDPSVAEKRQMLQALLADRFKLRAHIEQRDLPIYALVMARNDRRLGPQLRSSKADCARVDQPSPEALRIGPASADEAICGYFGFTPGTRLPDGGLAFRGMTMKAFSGVLMTMVRRTVVDETGLTGFYDADFDFMAELPPPPPPPGVPNPFTTPFLSVVTILPEQLGLKLDARRGPVDVLVVDSAEHPTEN